MPIDGGDLIAGWVRLDGEGEEPEGFIIERLFPVDFYVAFGLAVHGEDDVQAELLELKDGLCFALYMLFEDVVGIFYIEAIEAERWDFHGYVFIGVVLPLRHVFGGDVRAAETVLRPVDEDDACAFSHFNII